MKKKPFVLGMIAILLCGLTPLLASDDNSPRLTLLFSGWVTGTFGPCGCVAGPSGGFPRRAGFSRSYEKESGATIIQVDAGSLFAQPGPDAEVVNSALLKGLELLPVQVMNIGSEDLYMWPKLAASENLPTHFISSNLRPRSGDRAQPDEFAILTLPAEQTGLSKELHIGFLGIVDPARVKPNSGFRGMDPVQAVAEVMPQIRDQVDFVVVLADYFRMDSLEAESPLYQIASQNPEVYALITTERRYILHPPQQINNAVVLSSIERGRQLGRLVFEFDEKGKVESYQADFVDLDASIPDDPQLAGELSKLPPSN